MEGKLHSLTDLLKKTLFFFEAMTVQELVPYVQENMMKDYAPHAVKEKILLCLRQHSCFYCDGDGLWRLNLQGLKENDQIYQMLLKRQQPLNIKELVKGKKEKVVKHLLARESALMADGRFVQLANGRWGLTEWEVEKGDYTLKQLIVRALVLKPEGLSLNEITGLVNRWRRVDEKQILGILRKFPFFEYNVTAEGEGRWYYNRHIHVAYDFILQRFLHVLQEMRHNYHQQKAKWQEQKKTLQQQLNEIAAAYREAAAVLAEKVKNLQEQEQLLTQMAEKDLLLSLRKKEIYRYREHIAYLERKANNILKQCRIWVQRARENESQVKQMEETVQKQQETIEALFAKVQQYKEREREARAQLIELKENQAQKIAELEQEVLSLKQQEKRLHDEIYLLSTDLREALQREENTQRNLRFTQQELKRCREEFVQLEKRLCHPLVRFAVRLISWLSPGK